MNNLEDILLLEYNKENIERHFSSFFNKVGSRIVDDNNPDLFLVIFSDLEEIFENIAKEVNVDEFKLFIKDIHIFYYLSKVKKWLISEFKKNNLSPDDPIPADVAKKIRISFAFPTLKKVGRFIFFTSYFSEKKAWNLLEKKLSAEILNYMKGYFSLEYEDIMKAADLLFDDDVYNTLVNAVLIHNIKKNLDLIYKKDDVEVYRIESFEECRALGADTRWCTAGSTHGRASIENYKRWSNLYIFIYDDNEKYHLALPKIFSMVNQKPRPLETLFAICNIFTKYTLLDAKKDYDVSNFISKIKDSFQENIVFKDYNSFKERSLVSSYILFIKNLSEDMKLFSVLKYLKNMFKNKIFPSEMERFIPESRKLLTKLLKASEFADRHNAKTSTITFDFRIKGETEDKDLNLFFDLIKRYNESNFDDVKLEVEDYDAAFEVINFMLNKRQDFSYLSREILNYEILENSISNFNTYIENEENKFDLEKFLKTIDNILTSNDTEYIIVNFEKFISEVIINGKSVFEDALNSFRDTVKNVAQKFYGGLGVIEPDYFSKLIKKYSYSKYFSMLLKMLDEEFSPVRDEYELFGEKIVQGKHEVMILKVKKSGNADISEYIFTVLENDRIYYKYSVIVNDRFIELLPDNFKEAVYYLTSVYLLIDNLSYYDSVIDVQKLTIALSYIKKEYDEMVKTLSEKHEYPDKVDVKEFNDLFKKYTGADLDQVFNFYKIFPSTTMFTFFYKMVNPSVNVKTANRLFKLFTYNDFMRILTNLSLHMNPDMVDSQLITFFTILGNKDKKYLKISRFIDKIRKSNISSSFPVIDFLLNNSDNSLNNIFEYIMNNKEKFLDSDTYYVNREDTNNVVKSFRMLLKLVEDYGDYFKTFDIEQITSSESIKYLSLYLLHENKKMYEKFITVFFELFKRLDENADKTNVLNLIRLFNRHQIMFLYQDLMIIYNWKNIERTANGV